MVSAETAKKEALALPEVTEQPHFHRIAFRANNRTFATLDEKAKDMNFMLTPVDQSAFCAFDKTVIHPVSGGWGRMGWTTAELSKISKANFKDILRTAYETVMAKPKTKARKPKK